MKNRKTLSSISVIVAVCTLLGLFSICSFADVSEVKITASIACEGEIKVASKEFTVDDADGDGSLTVNDALIVIHKSEYNGDGYETEVTKYGLGIKKMWGVANGGSYGYYVNNSMAWSLTSPINEGDYLYAYVYEDAASYTDKFCYFDKYVTSAAKNETVSLTATKASGYDENYNPIFVPAEGAKVTVNGVLTDIVIDSDGKAEISFDKSGRYVVSVKGDGEILVPAVLVVGIDGWSNVNKSWYYVENCNYVTGWKLLSNNWYYFGKDGVMKTGWQKVGKSWYFLKSSGAMLTGWHKDGGKWYYLNPKSGAMMTGWKKINNKWYYLKSGGSMATGWNKVDGKWYLLGSNGVMLTGWQKDSGKWYYLNKSGVMLTGWQKIDSKWYYFNKSGVMLTGKKTINNKEYYFDTDGVYIPAKQIKAYNESYKKMLNYAKLGSYNSKTKRYIYAFDTISFGTGQKICAIEYDVDKDELYMTYIMNNKDFKSRNSVLIDKHFTNKMSIVFAYNKYDSKGNVTEFSGAVSSMKKDVYTADTAVTVSNYQKSDTYTKDDFAQLMTSQTAHIMVETDKYLTKNSTATMASLGYTSF